MRKDKSKKPTEKKSGKHPGGRPKIQITDLPKNWKDIIIEAGKIGKGEVEIRCELGMASGEAGDKICFSNDLWYRLIKENEEFSDIIKKAQIYCEYWWREQGRENMKSKESFNHGLWYMNMKNRFKWHDRQEQIHSGKIETGIDMDDFAESYDKYCKDKKSK